MIPLEVVKKPSYAWIIDVDHLADNGSEFTDAGRCGPRAATDEQLTALAAGEGLPFRILDDDGELYYTGRTIGGGPDADDAAAFGPLWDYGTPGAGATEIQYQVDGKWVGL